MMRSFTYRTKPIMPNTPPLCQWTHQGQSYSAPWRSQTGAHCPKRLVVADEHLRADDAYRLACEGTGLVWQGDYHNARRLLQAITRRLDRKAPPPASTPEAAFIQQRRAHAHRNRILGMLLLQFNADHQLNLPRAPDVQAACTAAHGPVSSAYLSPLRELLGIIGAYEWYKKGVHIPALNAHIHPHYGVFAPIRSEYIDLVVQTPLPSKTLAFDIGTGTGVLAAVLASRGVKKVIATDNAPRALACAQENIQRLGLAARIELLEADLFPPGQADLIVCNPPWVPAHVHSLLDQAVYDPNSQMLQGFLKGLSAHLTPQGEGWLILSDLAEHLHLRTPNALQEWIAQAGLKVRAKKSIPPRHPKARDQTDPLHQARAKEHTFLWQLVKA